MTTAVATQAGAAAPAKTYTVKDLLASKQQEILSALPRHITPSYFMRVVLTAVQKNPKLAQCTPMSFLGAVLQCAQLGLVPDGFLGQAYLIPYENSYKNDRGGWDKRLEAQFQCGYKGLVQLARRSGDVTTIHAEVVYEKDTFHQTFGINPTIEHEKYEGDDDPGPIKYVYAFYKLRDTSYDVVVMNRREVYRIRERSKAYAQAVKYKKTDSTPWVTDEAAMWKKTAIKQLMKLAPMSIEVQRVVGLDDAHEAGLPQDLALLVDPNAVATPLLEDGDEEPENLNDGNTIEMPRAVGQTAPPAAEPAPPVAHALPADQDRIAEFRPADSLRWRAGCVATTERGVMVFTVDATIAAALQTAFASKVPVRLEYNAAAEPQGHRVKRVTEAA